jgi:hypothetical protein
MLQLAIRETGRTPSAALRGRLPVPRAHRRYPRVPPVGLMFPPRRSPESKAICNLIM